jgi:hypothetical protein
MSDNRQQFEIGNSFIGIKGSIGSPKEIQKNFDDGCHIAGQLPIVFPA